MSQSTFYADGSVPLFGMLQGVDPEASSADALHWVCQECLAAFVDTAPVAVYAVKPSPFKRLNWGQPDCVECLDQNADAAATRDEMDRTPR